MLRAHVPAESNTRAKIHWSNKTNIPLVLQHNPSDVTASESALIVAESIANWNLSSPLPLISTTSADNKLYYSQDERFFGPGVVAVTALSYNQGSGKIDSGEILINQTANRSFCLSASKSASTCTPGGAGTFNRIYLGDVVTHELGHLMGLAHSEVRKSSMFYLATKGQYSPDSDDVSGLYDIYGTSNKGMIKGVVKGGSGVPVFGAHVQVISSRTGALAGAAISQEDGTFRIGGLSRDDVYYLWLEPLHNLDSLPDPFRTVKTDFCPGAWTGGFFEPCANSGKGHPWPLRLSVSQPILDVGTVSIRCNLRLGDGYLTGKSSGTGGEYDFIANDQRPAQAFVGWFPASSSFFTTFGATSTNDDTIGVDLSGLAVPSGSNPLLELRVLTAQLGAALDLSITVDGPTGTEVDADRILVGGYGTPNLDAATGVPVIDRLITYPLSATAALNRFTITLRPRALTATEKLNVFSSNTDFIASPLFWFAWVSVTHNPGSGQTPFYENRVDVVEDNRRCLEAPHTYTVTANTVAGSTIAAAANGQDDESSNATGTQPPSCGSWEPPTKGGPGGGLGASLMLGLAIGLVGLRRRHT